METDRVASATELRVHLGELMEWVTENHKPIIVEHRGEPRVVVLSMAKYQTLLAQQKERSSWQELVQQSRERIEAELGSAIWRW